MGKPPPKSIDRSKERKREKRIFATKEVHRSAGDEARRHAKEELTQPFVVIIKNVETDFSRIYKDVLPHFLKMKGEVLCADKQAAAARLRAGGGTAAAVVTPRTETHSAQIDLYVDSGTTTSGAAADEAELVQRCFRFEPAQQQQQQQQEGDEDGDGEAHVEIPKTVEAVAAKFNRRQCFGVPASVYKVEDLVVEEGAEGKKGDRRRVAQGSLVSAVARTSDGSKLAKEIRKLLKDVPGFVDVWRLRPATFRVVFCSEAMLFEAKALLDEFEAEGVRITVDLPASWQTRFDSFLANKASE